MEDLKRGMVLFSESANLMVRVKSVQDNGFTFRVMNGEWDGRLVDGMLSVDKYPEQETRLVDFREVVSVTRDEHGAWYMEGHTGTSRLIDATPGGAVSQDPAVIRSRIDTIADEHQWEEHELNDHAVNFILDKNLGDTFVSYLDAQPVPEAEDDDLDTEISF
jgi:hypothetical protein